MLKILHINSSEYAGGVAEMLVSLIHKFGEGYTNKRLVIDRPIEFFNVTKKIHNNLHGKSVEFTEKDIETYETDYSTDIKNLSMDYDIITFGLNEGEYETSKHNHRFFHANCTKIYC